MRKSKFTESQIVATLKQVEGGRQVKDVCRELGISDATYYVWKSKYGGMEAADVQRLRDHTGQEAVKILVFIQIRPDPAVRMGHALQHRAVRESVRVSVSSQRDSVQRNSNKLGITGAISVVKNQLASGRVRNRFQPRGSIVRVSKITSRP